MLGTVDHGVTGPARVGPVAAVALTQAGEPPNQHSIGSPGMASRAAWRCFFPKQSRLDARGVMSLLVEHMGDSRRVTLRGPH